VLGDPDEVAKRILELETFGVYHVYMYPIETFQFPEPELRAFREVIGPALKRSAGEKGAVAVPNVGAVS
jgi:hypothetical protein